MSYYMGIDIGTTAVKVIIIDNSGKVVVKSNKEYLLIFPKKNFVELDADALWNAVKQALREALDKFEAPPEAIISLALSTQRDTLVCVDADNHPLRNAITWMDSRSRSQCAALAREIGEDYIYRTTGVGVSTIWTLAFILWIRENQPEIYRGTHCFGLVHDFILCKLGATEHYLDDTNACQTMLYDYQKGCWDPALMEYAGLSVAQLPQLVSAGTCVGRLSAQVAAEFGLSPLTELVAGGGDQQVASLGAGCIAVGDVEIGIGTAANILVTSDHLIIDPKHRLMSHRAVLPGLWVLEGAMLSFGKVVEWLRETMYQGVSLMEMDEDIERHSVPGAGGLVLIPHFEGAGAPYWCDYAKGTLAGLSLTTTRADIARALLEGISMEIRKNLELLQEMALTVQRVTVSGGAAKSALWMQLLANVTGVAVITLQENDCAAYGAALIASIREETADLPKKLKEWVVVEHEYFPEAALTGVYQTLYIRHKNLYDTLDRQCFYRNDC